MIGQGVLHRAVAQELQIRSQAIEHGEVNGEV